MAMPQELPAAVSVSDAVLQVASYLCMELVGGP